MAARRKKSVRRRARGGPPAQGLRSAVRSGWAAFAAKLSAEGAVFAVVACAITLAVLSQDPGAKAAPPRPAGHPTCYPPGAEPYGRAMSTAGGVVAVPSADRDSTSGTVAKRSDPKRTFTRGRG